MGGCAGVSDEKPRQDGALHRGDPRTSGPAPVLGEGVRPSRGCGRPYPMTSREEDRDEGQEPGQGRSEQYEHPRLRMVPMLSGGAMKPAPPGPVPDQASDRARGPSARVLRYARGFADTIPRSRSPPPRGRPTQPTTRLEARAVK